MSISLSRVDPLELETLYLPKDRGDVMSGLSAAAFATNGEHRLTYCISRCFFDNSLVRSCRKAIFHRSRSPGSSVGDLIHF